MLEIKNACISYNNEILFSGFNMKLEKGQMACISGHSGKGKTSLLNAIMGFIPLCEGSIIVDNIELTRNTIDIVRRNIAWIPQELALPMEWVSQMVYTPFQLKVNRKTRFSENELFELFDELGLDKSLFNKRVLEISGGQRQRIMLAVTVMLRKPLIIIDEPTSALDDESMDRVLNFFRKRTAEGRAVLAVSHDNAFAAGCDKIINL